MSKRFRTKKLLTAAALLTAFSMPSQAFVGVLAEVAIKAAAAAIDAAAVRARWGDLIDGNKAAAAGDYEKAFRAVEQGFKERAEKNGANVDFDEVIRLARLNIYATKPETAKAFEQLLASQESRFLNSKNPLISAHYYLYRTSVADKLDKRNLKRYYLRKTIDEAKLVVERPIEGIAFWDRFSLTNAGTLATQMGKNMEIELYLHYVNLVSSEAFDSWVNGQDLEALELKRQANAMMDRIISDIKALDAKNEVSDDWDNERHGVAHYAYYAGDAGPSETLLGTLGQFPKIYAVADVLLRMGRYEDAEIIVKAQLSNLEKTPNALLENRVLQTALYAQATFAQGKHAKAESILTTTIERLRSEVKSKDIQSLTASELERLALMQVFFAQLNLKQQGQTEIARQEFAKGIEYLSIYLSSHNKLPLRRFGVSEEFWLGMLGDQFATLANNPANSEQILEAMQLIKNSQVADILSQVATRFSAEEGEMAQLIRVGQDITQENRAIEKQLASFPPGQLPNATIEILRKRRQELVQQLKANREELTKRFPQYMELTRSSFVSTKELRSLLAANEALVSWFIGETESVLLLAKASSVQVFKLKTGRTEISTLIGQLHKDLDPNTGDLNNFDFAKAYRLYEQLLKPAEDALRGIGHLQVVTDGVLSSLPLAVLITREAKESQVNFGNAQWLIKRHAFNALPAISSLRALRATARPTAAQQAFVGVGDPLFADHPAIGGTPTRSAKRIVATRGLFSTGLADPKVLRSVPSLPETADELKDIAKSLGASTQSLYLREAATERNVRNLPLKNYRVIAFATHGIMSDEIKGVGEPGLLLTPPERPTEDDDGVLTASEIAKLKLDADWTLLSACNTAASDGKPDAEGLTGLAKAFAYAGARTLVVSHWSVPSESTAALTSKMFQTHAAGGVSKAEAHRQAMLHVMRMANGRFAHPSYWGAFFVVGDGGEKNIPFAKRGS